MYEKITLFGLYSSMVVTILKTLLISLRRRALDIKNIGKYPNLKCKLYMNVAITLFHNTMAETNSCETKFV